MRGRRRRFLDWSRRDWRRCAAITATSTVGLPATTTVARPVHASAQRPFSAALPAAARRPHTRRADATQRPPHAAAPTTRPASTAVAGLVNNAAVAHWPPTGAASTVRSPARAAVARPIGATARGSAQAAAPAQRALLAVGARPVEASSARTTHG